MCTGTVRVHLFIKLYMTCTSTFIIYCTSTCIHIRLYVLVCHCVFTGVYMCTYVYMYIVHTYIHVARSLHVYEFIPYR